MSRILVNFKLYCIEEIFLFNLRLPKKLLFSCAKIITFNIFDLSTCLPLSKLLLLCHVGVALVSLCHPLENGMALHLIFTLEFFVPNFFWNWPSFSGNQDENKKWGGTLMRRANKQINTKTTLCTIVNNLLFKDNK